MRGILKLKGKIAPGIYTVHVSADGTRGERVPWRRSHPWTAKHMLAIRDESDAARAKMYEDLAKAHDPKFLQALSTRIARSKAASARYSVRTPGAHLTPYLGEPTPERAAKLANGYDLEGAGTKVPGAPHPIQRGKIKTPLPAVEKAATERQARDLRWAVGMYHGHGGKPKTQDFTGVKGASSGRPRALPMPVKAMEDYQEFVFVWGELNWNAKFYMEFLADALIGENKTKIEDVGEMITRSKDERVQKGGFRGTYRAIADSIDKARADYRVIIDAKIKRLEFEVEKGFAQIKKLSA